jgi:hypothetical protein
VYDFALADDGVVDVCVEDPNESFQRLRDVTDVANLRERGFSKLNMDNAMEMYPHIKAALKLSKVRSSGPSYRALDALKKRPFYLTLPPAAGAAPRAAARFLSLRRRGAAPRVSSQD